MTAEVFALSKTLFAELWDGYTPLRLLGVTLGDVSDNETVQLSMFQDDQKDRARKLDQTVDQLRSKFGVTAISVSYTHLSEWIGLRRSTTDTR